MKYLKSWLTVFIISFIIINSMLFFVLITENRTLPSEDWSRSYEVHEFSATDEVIYNVIYKTVFSSTYNEFIITSYFSDSKIFIMYLDEQLNIIKTNYFDVETSIISNFQGSIVNNQLIVFIEAKDDKGLYKHVYNLITGELIESYIYEKDIKYVSYYEDTALIYNNNTLILWNGKTEIILDDNFNTESIALYNNFGNWNLLSIESNMGSNRLLKKYTIENDKIYFNTEISSLENGSSNKPNEIKVIIEKNHIKILTKIIQKQYNSNFIKIISFDDKTNKIIVEYKFNNEMSMPNTILIESEMDEIKYIQSDLASLGMMDISSKGEKYYNLFIETLEDDNLESKMLTKTINISNHPNYFEHNNNYYLQWVEVSNGDNMIMFSSNESNLVNESKKLMKGELFNIVWSVFSSNMVSIFFFLFVAVGIVLPIIFTIVPISIIFFDWSEKNQDKLFIIAIIIHVTSKFYYLNNFIKENIGLSAKLPGILSNQYFQYTIPMFTSIIAYYCLQDYVRKNETKNFLFKYLFFLVIDIILFILIIFPYRML